MEKFSLPQAQPFDFPQGDHGVLLIHGFTGSPSHMRLIGDGLRARGFAVRGIQLPGHGTSPKDMAKASFRDYFQCVREHALDMRRKYKTLTVSGLSMGGCLALWAAERMKADYCVPIAAPMKTTARFRSLAPLLSPVYPMVHKRADGARDTLNADYDIGYDSYPTKCVHDLNVVIAKARRDLSLIRCPVLVIQSRGDQTVTQDSPRIILNSVSSERKDQLWLKAAPHVCTISPEYPVIAEKMARFLHGQD